MKFGPVPVADAEGAILAHSEHLPSGRLRKGALLTTQHLHEMVAAGVTHVTVAQLEAGDVHEDAAALALARASVGQAADLRLANPFTGRVNIYAERTGVVVLDAERIIAANSVDPCLTIATVPPFHHPAAGGMIATVKVISYAVPEAALHSAVAHAQGAVRLAAVAYRSASLIITDIAGGPGEKGREAIETRVRGLGLVMREVRVCAHDEAALAQEIVASTGDIVLILTGSATSDLRDTAPEAVRRAGGTVQRFGMPVDPGNLLFLGEVSGRPVIGLPGSARSPVLHGADWVLNRVACGIAISDHDFAAMGVGGLLKEIPTRPQPRRGKDPL